MPFDESAFLDASVNFADADWHERFAALKSRGVIHLMPAERGPLPDGQDPYEQNNLWMLESADRFGKSASTSSASEMGKAAMRLEARST